MVGTRASFPQLMSLDDYHFRGSPYALDALEQALERDLKYCHTSSEAAQCGLYALEIALKPVYRAFGLENQSPSFHFLKGLKESSEYRVPIQQYLSSLPVILQEFEEGPILRESSFFDIGVLRALVTLLNVKNRNNSNYSQFPKLSIATISEKTTNYDSLGIRTSQLLVDVNLCGHVLSKYRTFEPVDTAGLVWLWNSGGAGSHWSGMIDDRISMVAGPRKQICTIHEPELIRHYLKAASMLDVNDLSKADLLTISRLKSHSFEGFSEQDLEIVKEFHHRSETTGQLLIDPYEFSHRRDSHQQSQEGHVAVDLQPLYVPIEHEQNPTQDYLIEQGHDDEQVIFGQQAIYEMYLNTIDGELQLSPPIDVSERKLSPSAEQLEAARWWYATEFEEFPNEGDEEATDYPN